MPVGQREKSLRSSPAHNAALTFVASDDLLDGDAALYANAAKVGSEGVALAHGTTAFRKNATSRDAPRLAQIAARWSLARYKVSD